MTVLSLHSEISFKKIIFVCLEWTGILIRTHKFGLIGSDECRCTFSGVNALMMISNLPWTGSLTSFFTDKLSPE